MMLPFEKLNHPVVSVSKPWKKNVAASIPEAQTVKSNRIPAKIAADFLKPSLELPALSMN
jgi:hypothetical protein